MEGEDPEGGKKSKSCQDNPEKDERWETVNVLELTVGLPRSLKQDSTRYDQCLSKTTLASMWRTRGVLEMEKCIEGVCLEQSCKNILVECL